MKDEYIKNDNFCQAIMAAIEDVSRKNSALMISDRLENLAIEGYHSGSIAPFGYRSVKVETENFGHIVMRNKLMTHTGESAVVKTLFELANELIIQDEFSYTALAHMINEKELHRRNSIWSPKNVKSTLIDTRYYGVRIYGSKRSEVNAHKNPLEIKCPAIVTKHTFDKVNRFITKLKT
ncbi:hypothetical protein A9Q81_06190 [Gammaproteobacteria bacterium 42_54_T18]|nr:hypothetical protein A9Q81_06190 [Gammaproteobacteria bacterium 42_54_T18]